MKFHMSEKLAERERQTLLAAIEKLQDNRKERLASLREGAQRKIDDAKKETKRRRSAKAEVA